MYEAYYNLKAMPFQITTDPRFLWIGEKHFHLKPGDSFRFKGERHRWRNPGTEPAIAIWVIAPPVY